MAQDNNRSPFPDGDDEPQHEQQRQQPGHNTASHEATQTSERGGNQIPSDHDTANSDNERHSETPTEKYQQRVEHAGTVWFSGILSGRSYAPRPKKVHEAELSEDAKEELLKERTYTIPRGYKYYKADLPPVLDPTPQNGFRTALLVHIVLYVIAFVFTLASACPIPWYRGRDVLSRGVNYKGRQFTLWKSTGGSYPTVSVRTMTNCPLEKQFYQTIAVCTIVGCVLSVISLLIAGARLSGRTSYGWVLLFSFLAFAWTACGNAMSISLYYLSRCDAPRFSSSARLDAGFALTLVAWVLQLGGLLAIVLVTKVNIGPVLKEVRVMDTIYIAVLCVALLFLCVANATTVWKRRFKDNNVDVVRVTYWHTELIMPNGTNLYYGRRHYRCGAYGKRMKASISFLILASISLFLSIMLAIPAFIARGCRIASLTFSIITLVFLIISWVTAVAVRYRKSCTGAVNGSVYVNYPGVPSGIFDGLTSFPGYGVQEGLILSIVGWILVLGATCANIAVPWPEVRA
ncbi:Amastin surface glycoprotein [Novymonas esmeraldas]|uniref:Amastin surface glycoprotein n=1 Tax=Novymonas esmeraldas TaxID=1808958 RepID=A0AAW0F6W2_9TRYP